MSALGDTILTLPVACALRARYPEAFLAWAVEQNASAFVVGHPALDDVVLLERGWFASPGRLLAARRRLREGRFDAAIDCQGLTKSALACWLSGAKRRIGHRGEHGRELSPWLNNVLVDSPKPHVIDRSLALLEPLDVIGPAVEWRLPIDEAAQTTARQAVERLGLERGYAVINPGATWDSRLWEWDRFGAVARYIARRHGLATVVVWAGDRERGWAEAIASHAGGEGVVAPPTTLHELAALIGGARLMLSSDTGPMHLAVAVGTPTISLHGPTRPEESGPYGPPHAALQVEYQAGSHTERRGADNRAMRRITVEMVCEAVDRLLGLPTSG